MGAVRLSRGIERMIDHPPYLEGLIRDLDGFMFDASSGLFTLNTQPVLANWSGANWAGAGLGPYTHTAGATTDLSQAIEIVGNRYATAFSVSGCTAGQVTHKSGTTAGTARVADGAYTEELLCATDTGHKYTPDNAFDGSVTTQSVANLSLNRWDPVALGASWAGTYISQATATSMPWRSSTRINGMTAMQSDNSDGLFSAGYSGSPYNGVHSGSSTWFVVIQPTSIALTVLLRTTNGAGPNAGVYTSILASGKVEAAIGNASGTLMCDLTSVATVGTAVPSVIVCRHTAGSAIDLWVNGTKATSGLTGAESGTAASDGGMWILGMATAWGVRGYSLAAGACLRAMTDAQIAFVGRSLAEKWGGVWA